MRLFWLLLASCFAFSARAQQSGHLHNPNKGNPGTFTSGDITARTGSGGYSINSTGYSGTGSNINVVYHRVNWTIDPNSATKTITGTVVTYFKTLVANVSSITFDLNSTSFSNGSLIVTHHGNTCTKTCASNILTITLSSTIATLGTLDSVTINYSGIPPGTSGAAEGYQSGLSGTDKYIMTLSESFEDRDWWPCKADMQDKIDSMDINVTVPWKVATADTFWVATNGTLYDSTITGLNRTFKFRTRYPIASYLVAVSVARFTRYHRVVNVSGTNVPVQYYLLRNNASQAACVTAMDKMLNVITAFGAKFGDYPFKLEKHGYYEGLLGAGGMEHQTFSAMATTDVQNLQTLTHELMHQWFGDNVTFATWNDLWLAEGFASYSEGLAAELVPSLGLNPYTIHSTAKTSALSNTTESAWIPNGSIGSSTAIWNSNYGSTVYDRGHMIVSMLRAICGDTKFYQALSSYQTALSGKTATTDSLRNYINAALGKDISQFFTDYVGGSGSAAAASGGVGNPVNNINWNSPSSNQLVVQIGSQTRTSGSNVSYFHGPIVLHFANGAAGSWTKDTTVVIYDWGNGTMSYAGNGLTDSVPGNILNYTLSFTPTNAFYDDSARTMSTGSMTKVTTLMGYTWTGATNSTWSTSSNWASCCNVPPSGAQITIATTGSAPTLTSNITVDNVLLNSGKTLNLNGYTLTVNGTIS
ncbi:MAG TPA: M1 family aminopeptidase, partial [Ferruginibacter sp.]|nr:M1 family aminopeptidase [Ferruginibacter sp.]